jgi:hypothetical protein
MTRIAGSTALTTAGLIALLAGPGAQARSLDLYADAGLGWHSGGVERCIEHPLDQARSGCAEPYGRLALGLQAAALVQLGALELSPYLEYRHESSAADGGLRPNAGDRGTEQLWLGVRATWSILDW